MTPCHTSQLKDFISRRRKELKAQVSQNGVVVGTHIQTSSSNNVQINKLSAITLEQRSSSDESATPTKESSSLSSGNIGPTTPSPERMLFYNKGSTVNEKALGGLGEMDPHLANLLNNLNVSANGISNHLPIAKAVTPNDSTASESASGIFHSTESGLSNPTSATTSSSTGTSSANDLDQQKQPALNTTTAQPPKRSKHIALLDSVVEDIELSSSTEPTHSTSQPHPSLEQHNHSNQFMNEAGRPASVATFPPYSYPYYNRNGAPLPNPAEPGHLPLYGQYQSAQMVNFPVRTVTSPPVYPGPYQQPPRDMLSYRNQAPFPRPLTSQSQVLGETGPLAPNGAPIPFPPLPRGLQPPAMPLIHQPGSHQSQLLSLLSPRSRAISQPPQLMVNQQTPRAHPRTGIIPAYEPIYNGYIPLAVPPSSLVSPPKRNIESFPNTQARREIAPNAQLLSILNGGMTSHPQASPSGAPRHIH